MLSPVALQAQNFRSRLCADEMDAPILGPSRDEMVALILGPSRDDVASGLILHAPNSRVKARRVPSARPLVVVAQHEIHDVCRVVELSEQTLPKHDALVAVPGCTARSAVARTRRHVAGRAPGGSILPRAAAVRGCVLPLRMRGATAAALRVLPPKARGTGELRTAANAHAARHCPALSVSAGVCAVGQYYDVTVC
jgi:hypothetical protein